jgi:hypothetical protein
MSVGLQIVLAVGLACASACNASNSVEPTDFTPVALAVTNTSTLAVPIVRGLVTFRVYAATRDGGYSDVTSSATWTVSDPLLLQPFSTPGTFTALNAGVAQVLASYQGLSASAGVIVIRSDRLAFPYLNITSVPMVMKVGDSYQVEANLQQVQFGPLQRVTDAATWSSDDPRVTTVERGLVKGVGVGSAFLTVQYGGVSNSFSFSIHPR